MSCSCVDAFTHGRMDPSTHEGRSSSLSCGTSLPHFRSHTSAIPYAGGAPQPPGRLSGGPRRRAFRSLRLPSRAGCAGSAYARLRRPSAIHASPVFLRPFRDLHVRHPASRAASCGRPASCGPSGVRHPAAPRGAVPAPAVPRAPFWAPHRPRHLPSRAGGAAASNAALRLLRALASLALPRPVRRRPGGGAVAALAALFDHPRLSRPAWDARTTPISDPRSSTSEAPLQRTHRPTPGPARRTNTNGGKERQPRQEDNNRKNPENPEQKGLLPKNNARHRAGRLAPLPRTCPERTQPRRRLVPARLPVRPTSGGDAAAVDAPRSRARHAATPPSAALDPAGAGAASCGGAAGAAAGQRPLAGILPGGSSRHPGGLRVARVLSASLAAPPNTPGRTASRDGIGIPAPPQERLEGEGTHSPPSNTIILQLSTLKKIREKKTISTRHDVEPLRVHIATGGGPLPSSNQSVRPCAALPIFITNTAPHVPSLRPLRSRRHHVQRIELMGGFPCRPARASYRPVKVVRRDPGGRRRRVQRRRVRGGVVSTLTGRWRVRGGLHGKLRVVKGKPSEPADDHEPSGEERGGGEGEKGGFGYLQYLLSCPAGWGRGPPSWRGAAGVVPARSSGFSPLSPLLSLSCL